jgi:hypothetical protein
MILDQSVERGDVASGLTCVPEKTVPIPNFTLPYLRHVEYADAEANIVEDAVRSERSLSSDPKSERPRHPDPDTATPARVLFIFLSLFSSFSLSFFPASDTPIVTTPL